jgi:hypothetical protein
MRFNSDSGAVRPFVLCERAGGGAISRMESSLDPGRTHIMVMHRGRRIARLVLAWLSCGLLAVGASAQPDDLTLQYYVPYPVDSGPLDNPSGSPNIVFQTTIAPGPYSFVRVHFAFAHLPPGSSLQLIADADSAVQTLDAADLYDWDHSSAYLNGSSLQLALVAGPFTVANQVVVDSVWVGDPDLSGMSVESICGTRDTRVLSSNAAVGRLLINDRRGSTLAFGTAFIIDTPQGIDKCHLSAGHNFASSANRTYVLEFNVAASDTACNPKFSKPEFQFPVLKTTLTYDNSGIGKDWAVFRCGKSDGKTDFQKQGAALPLATSIPDSGDARVTGYGRDNTASDDAGGGNASCGACASPNGRRHRVQQTDTGRFYRINATTLEHRVDTCPANSGSPILNETNGRVIGIHTQGGCDAGTARNSGTRVDQDSLALTIAGCKAVPIVVSDLEIGSSLDGVTLRWRLGGGSLEELREVVVERAPEAAGPYSGSATLVPQAIMSFADRDVRSGDVHWYRLALVDHDGDTRFVAPVRVEVAASWANRLDVAHPREASQPVTIRYAIARTGRVDLAVYDVSGRLVRRIDRQTRAAGEYLQSWDRRDSSGRTVARGVYVVRLGLDASSLTQKIVLAR